MSKVLHYPVDIMQKSVWHFRAENAGPSFLFSRICAKSVDHYITADLIVLIEHIFTHTFTCMFIIPASLISRHICHFPVKGTTCRSEQS